MFIRSFSELGDGSGEVSYDSQNNAVSTGLGPEQITYNLDLAGCENSTVTQDASVPLNSQDILLNPDYTNLIRIIQTT